MTYHQIMTNQFGSIIGKVFLFPSAMSRRSEERGYQLDTTVLTSHHDTYRAAHSSTPNQLQLRSVIESLGPQRSPHDRQDLREHLIERRPGEAERAKEIEELQRENERL